MRSMISPRLGCSPPEPYVSRIKLGDPHDPLFRQIWPGNDESATPSQAFQADPVGDSEASIVPGLIQKYRNRALMITTGACAVHCRYCFRRHFEYQHSPPEKRVWKNALHHIESDRSLREVILSGGDPLTLVDDAFSWLVTQIDQVSHVRRLRIHTRLPVVIPQRVTETLSTTLRSTRCAAVVVLHINHANEVDERVAVAIERMRSAGVTLLNQAVLLRDINDTIEAQCEFSERLGDVGVVPYYLHQLDRVIGAAHFEVDQSKGVQLIDEMRSRLPGYLVPRYVRETAGQPNKTPIERLAD